MEPLKENQIQDSEKTEPQISQVPQTPTMRTFSTDLAEELRKHQGAAMKKAMLENEQRLREQGDDSDNPKRNRRFVFGGIIVLLFAIGASIGVYVYQKKMNAPIPLAASSAPVSIIPYEDSMVLNLSDASSGDISSTIASTVQKSNIQTGMIDSISLVQGGATSSVTQLTSPMFLSAIKSHIPPDFSLSLSNQYMLGIYSYEQPNLFVILRGTAHDTMLAGMLEWESFLTEDFAPMFGIDTTGDNAYLLNAPYSETLIENHDTRAVLDKAGKPILFYSFLDQDTVIITNDSQTLIEAVRRINS